MVWHSGQSLDAVRLWSSEPALLWPRRRRRRMIMNHLDCNMLEVTLTGDCSKSKCVLVAG